MSLIYGEDKDYRKDQGSFKTNNIGHLKREALYSQIQAQEWKFVSFF